MMSVEMIQNKYNPEKDMIPGGPDVNWVDMELLSLIEGLHKRVEYLEAYIANLSHISPPAEPVDDPSFDVMTSFYNNCKEK
jgi:hypothetical protein